MISAPGAILDCADLTFNVRDMFVGCSSVDVWMPWMKSLKLMVSKDGLNEETTRLVEGYYILKNLVDCGDLTIGKCFNSDKVNISRLGDEEWNFVDKHDISAKDDVTILP